MTRDIMWTLKMAVVIMNVAVRLRIKSESFKENQFRKWKYWNKIPSNKRKWFCSILIG